MKIITTLTSIGTQKCLAKAKELEKVDLPIQRLHLRSLDLKAVDAAAIAKCLHEEKRLESISFSYNPIGDLGTIALLKKLPKSVTEIGLVDCGITDFGGIELLNWIKKSPQLRIICIEQNDFSATLKDAFRKFSINRPDVLIVF